MSSKCLFNKCLNKRSFSKRLSISVIGIVTSIFIVTLFVVGITSARIIEDEATRSTQYMLHGTISDIERPLNELEVQTSTVAAHVGLQIKDINTLDIISQNTVKMSDIIDGLAIIIPGATPSDEYIIYNYRDPEGEIHTRRQKGVGMMQSEWLQAIAKGRKPLWTAPYYAEHRGGGQEIPRVTTYGFPVFDKDSNLLAIVTSDLTIKWIEEKMASIRPYENSMASISCSENVVIGIDDSIQLAQIRKAFAESEELRELSDDMRKGKDSIRRRIGKGRDMFFVAYGPLHNGWMLAISCYYRDVLKSVSIMNRILLILGLLEIILVFFSCRRIISKMTRPITTLSDAALNMAKGNFNADIPEIRSQDEMKNLRDSFVYMQNSIVDYIEELKTTTRANERMESELNVARNIQMGMLRSDFPQRLHALLVPAKEVGGDIYDFVIKDNTLYFAIGDVSGKGVPASLMMAITRAALRFVVGLNLPMDQTLERINKGVTDSNSNEMFVTLFVGRIDMITGRMEYCNAGHNPIIVIPPDGEPYFLKAKPNIAVGVFFDFHYQSETLDLRPGTRIIAYTDGVNEAERSDGSQYGNEGLLEWATQPTNRSLATSDKEVVEKLYDSVKEFADGNPQNDDITIMSITI